DAGRKRRLTGARLVAALNQQARLPDHAAAELHPRNPVGRRDRVLVLIALAGRGRGADRLPARLRAALLACTVDDDLARKCVGRVIEAERVDRRVDEERRSEARLAERGPLAELREQRLLAR